MWLVWSMSQWHMYWQNLFRCLDCCNKIMIMFRVEVDVVELININRREVKRICHLISIFPIKMCASDHFHLYIPAKTEKIISCLRNNFQLYVVFFYFKCVNKSFCRLRSCSLGCILQWYSKKTGRSHRWVHKSNKYFLRLKVVCLSRVL